MLAYLLRRLGQSALVLLAVSLIAFMVFRHIGDPTISLVGEDATLEERAALNTELKAEVLSKIKAADLASKTVTVTGAFQLVNPAGFLITPVKIEVK